MTPGERVKQIRQKNNLTLEKFGERVGVTKQTISRIENNINSLTEQMILSICREFNVNDEWLRTGNGEMFVNIDRENQLMMWAGKVLKDDSNDFKQRFVKMLSNLGEDDWKLLEKFALNLIEERPNSEKSDSEKPHEES